MHLVFRGLIPSTCNCMQIQYLSYFISSAETIMLSAEGKDKGLNLNHKYVFSYKSEKDGLKYN